jgi:hypothetical protein
MIGRGREDSTERHDEMGERQAGRNGIVELFQTRTYSYDNTCLGDNANFDVKHACVCY